MGLVKNILDFEILETGNTKTIVFVDASNYIEQPEKPLLEIILPGYSNYFLINVAAGMVNTFNASTIGLSKVFDASCLIDLPDGIYQYKYKICPYDKTFISKSYMRVTNLLLKLQGVYNGIDLTSEVDKYFKSTLIDIHILIKGAQLLAAKNPVKAQANYLLASNLTDKLNCKIYKDC